MREVNTDRWQEIRKWNIDKLLTNSHAMRPRMPRNVSHYVRKERQLRYYTHGLPDVYIVAIFPDCFQRSIRPIVKRRAWPAAQMYISTEDREKFGKVKEVRRRCLDDGNNRNNARSIQQVGRWWFQLSLLSRIKLFGLIAQDVKTCSASCLSNWLFQCSISGEWEARGESELKILRKTERDLGITIIERKFGDGGSWKNSRKGSGSPNIKINKNQSWIHVFLSQKLPRGGFLGVSIIAMFLNNG